MIKNIPIEKIHPNNHNPRKDLGNLTELADSIKANGVMQNLTIVNRLDNNTGKKEEDNYTIIIGHRRLAAAKMAELTELPCSIIEEMSFSDQMGIMLMENIQRNDLTIYEEAQGMQLMMSWGDSVADIAEKTGLAQSTIYKRTKLLTLNEEKFKEGVKRGANLMDFMELDKIKGSQRKEYVLESIGTSDFDFKLKEVLKVEAREDAKQAKLIEIKAYAKEIDIKDIKDYRHIGSFIDCNEYKGEYTNNKEDVQYYYMEFPYSINLYLRKEEDGNDSIKEDKVEDEVRKELEEKRIKESEQNERRKLLMEKNKVAYELRFDFIRKISNATAKKNMSLIIACLLKCSKYTILHIELTNLLDFLEVEIEIDEDDEEQIILDCISNRKLTDVSLLWLIADGIDGTNVNFTDWYARYKKNEELDEWYNLLEYLGYKISEEEKQLADGTHELYLGD